MSSNDSVPFIARLRSAGQTKGSLIVTVDKDVVELLSLKKGDIVEIRIKKARPVVT